MSIPNLISLGRLLTVPVTVWLILTHRIEAAFWLFLAAAVSDAVDGQIAKRFGAMTELGAYLDPLADKALLVAVFVSLGYQGLLPLWLVIMVVFRDALIIGGVILIHTVTDSVSMRPLTVSKINTAAQLALAVLVLGVRGFEIDDGGLTTALVYVVGGTTLASGAAYVVAWTRHTAAIQRQQ